MASIRRAGIGMNPRALNGLAHALVDVESLSLNGVVE